MGLREGPSALQGPIAGSALPSNLKKGTCPHPRGPLEGPRPLAPRNWWTLEKPLAPLLKGHWPLPRPKRPGVGG